jgi:hypothetical protein
MTVINKTNLITAPLVTDIILLITHALDLRINFTHAVGALHTSWFSGRRLGIATTSSRTTAKFWLSSTALKTWLSIRIHLTRRGVASGRVGFVFLSGAAAGILAGHLVAGTRDARLSVGFMLLGGLVVVVFIGRMIVRPEGARLAAGSHVTSVHALRGNADILGSHGSWILGTVIFMRSILTS